MGGKLVLYEKKRLWTYFGDIDGYDGDDDYDFLPLSPAPQDHPLENDDIYSSYDEEYFSDSEDDESDDELEGSW